MTQIEMLKLVRSVEELLAKVWIAPLSPADLILLKRKVQAMMEALSLVSSTQVATNKALLDVQEVPKGLGPEDPLGFFKRDYWPKMSEGVNESLNKTASETCSVNHSLSGLTGTEAKKTYCECGFPYSGTPHAHSGMLAKKFNEEKPKQTHNQVEHPPHYTQGNIEVIDFIEDQKLGFNLGNVVKYVCRSAHKGTPATDLEKAMWYLRREITR